MHTLTELRALLEARALRPKKSLGQNFLIDKNLGAKLIDASGVGAGSMALEIGPGAGALTEGILARGCRVVGAELDDALADLLAERFRAEAASGRFTLVRGDCLAGKRSLAPPVLEALRDGGAAFTLVSNLPYQTATPVMAILATSHHPAVVARRAAGEPACLGQFVTIQREVADRLLAAPGSKDYGALTVLVQAFARLERIATLPPECFWPRPEVTSAMIAIRPLDRPLTPDPDRLGAICARAFRQRRKKIRATIPEPAGGWPTGVFPDQRPEELTVGQWAALAEAGQAA